MGARGCRDGYQPCPAFLPALPATIALLGEDGHLVILSKDLEEGASQAPCTGSALLQERRTYVLVQIISKWGPILVGHHFGQNLALTLLPNALS